MKSASFRFGSVGSTSSTPPKPGGSIGTIANLAEQGLFAFELAWVRWVRVSEATCAAIKETAAQADVRLSVHAPYFINLNADDEEWPKSRKRLMDAAHFGNLAGATDIVFHPGSYFRRPPEEVLKVAIPRLRDCIAEMRSNGNPVTLRPETMGKSAMLGSLGDTLVMAQEIEGVLPCIDFSHLHARPGDGSMNTQREWTEALEEYRKALGADSLKNLHCHLSGIDYGPKGERKHLMIQDSDLNLAELLQALADMGCGGRILCESPDGLQDQDALHIQSQWQLAIGKTP